MKNQALFSLKDKSKKLKCHLLQFLFGALRVNTIFHNVQTHLTHFPILLFQLPPPPPSALALQEPI